MSISIKPAELVGAEIGDRVRGKVSGHFGTIRNIDYVDAFDEYVVMVQWSDPEKATPEKPHLLELAPREWKLGDVVKTAEEYDSLPVSTVVRDPDDATVAVKDYEGHWEWTGIEDPYRGHGMVEIVGAGLHTVILYLPEKAAA